MTTCAIVCDTHDGAILGESCHQQMEVAWSRARQKGLMKLQPLQHPVIKRKTFYSIRWSEERNILFEVISFFQMFFFFSWKFVPVSFPSLHWRTLFIASHFHPCPFEISNSYHLSSGKSLIRLIMPDCLPKTGRAETALNAGRNKPGLAGIPMRRKTVIHIATEK